ncbi:uncharacterized protein LOC107268594 isoform X2 [Cephus cinctus]|uniref:Uncharacterized protein LOC107268594 isoform X2 n=1 Tax=Cephus cinctus TaxID=211228 RepID=A0AAJ7W226_CEPCN|nr:uncharacterized protein LOC107268594 isoform X2 [Cephus cinctus]
MTVRRLLEHSGGIMQTEEVVPSARSTGVESSPTDDSSHLQQHHPPLHHSTQVRGPVSPNSLRMAVKQEPAPEDEDGDEEQRTLSSERDAGSFLMKTLDDLLDSPQVQGDGMQIPMSFATIPTAPTPLAPLTPPTPPTPTSGTHGHRQINGFEENAQQVPHDNGGGKPRPSRGRRKSRWKLKFHHQALPPEYLDHYEAALAQEALNASPSSIPESTAPSPAPTASTTASAFASISVSTSTPTPSSISTSTSTSTKTSSPVADVHGWLQRIATMQQELCPIVLQHQNQSQSHSHQHQQHYQSADTLPAAASRRSVITSTSHSYPSHHSTHHSQHTAHSQQHHHQQHHQQPTPRPPMKYSDLPYMGEITLDNSKPRRGRKPKKADICHLIYKNYGTILPGTPGHEEKKQPVKSKPESRTEHHNHPQVSFQRTDIQNRISSLLEKRLTQESRRNLALAESLKLSEQDEPLNLCIRDLNQLKIRLLRKHGNVYESGQVKSEASSDAEEVECLGSSSSPPILLDVQRSSDPLIYGNHHHHHNHHNIHGHNQHANNNNASDNNNSNSSNNNEECTGFPQNPGFVYWPNAGVFIHPMALQSQFLYYQKMAQADKPFGCVEPTPKEQKIVPKSIFSMLDGGKSSGAPVGSGTLAQLSPSGTTPTTGQPQPTPPASLSGSSPIAAPESPRPKRNAPLGHQSQSQPTKRKRSAIFIPPMPTENNNNPATEVSICKFKFTGGAKPSLQEKKSLSVDSGGNFRYYSGTGDKSMRGYEFFPRESLQQPAGQAGSSAGAFLSAAGERIPAPVTGASVAAAAAAAAAVAASCQRPPAIQEDGRRKRKTRKSLQREKLEQTFKEKGFLIQTQQLESAEGATYCKFRQLRKFTRYLFRSWKDYLPGNVRELTGASEADVIEADPEVENEVDPESPIVGSPLSSSLAPSELIPGPELLEESRTLSLTP